MNFDQIKATAMELNHIAPFIAGIENDDDYNNALALMDDLFEDYDNFKPLIDMLAPSIEEWENSSEEFADFNASVAGVNKGVALLATLMEQHEIKVDGLQEEIGGKSLVSLILNDKRNLTIDHILALSKRFSLPASMFLPE